MARTSAEAAYKNPELVRGGVSSSIQPRRSRSSSKPNCARSGPTPSWNLGGSTTPASATSSGGDIAGYKATRSAMGDMAKSLERDPQLNPILANRERNSASHLNAAVGSARSWPSATGINWQRPRHRNLIHPSCRPIRYTPHYDKSNSPLPACKLLVCVSVSAAMSEETASRRQRGPCISQDRPHHLKTILPDPGCPDPPSTARLPRARSRPSSKQ